MAVDVQQARDFLRRRARRQQAAYDLLFAQAWQDVRHIVEMLVARYQPVRIYQWGSLLDRRHFTDISDIDLAVEGIPTAERFFALYGEADRLTRFSLDLVQLERLEPEFASLIRQHGAIVYDREQPNPGPHYRN
jgi:predicted nucleotidyltransferase